MMKSIDIHNGVDLHIIDAPKFKTNLMSVYLNIPLTRSDVTQAALLPSVLKRGCIKYPTMKDLSRRLDDLYSASLSAGVRTKGDGEVLFFSAQYIADKYSGESLTGEIAEFLYSFIFEPLTENGGFLSGYVEGEKINLKNAILGLINDKKEYAEVKCREAMFGQQGYGMFEAGYVEDLDDISPYSLYSFYSRVLKTAKIDIFLSGSIDDIAVNKVKEILCSSFTPRNASYIQTSAAILADNADIKYVTEDADVVQSKLCIGLRCGVEATSPDYPALMLASCIFGGSPFSKLFNNVREKLSLAYYAVAKVSRFNSVMMISSGIQTENYKAAYDEIMVQFNKMCSGEITSEEIEAGKKYLSNSLNSMNDKLYGMEDYYLSQVIMGTNQSTEDLLNEIMNVDKEKICSVMNRICFDTVYFLKGKTEEVAE